MDEKRVDLPYGAEYAKSNRSTCKGCKDPIFKDSLRMSIRNQSRYFDGLQDNWSFHFECFWKRNKYQPINERSIRGIDNLKWDDQEKIRQGVTNATDYYWCHYRNPRDTHRIDFCNIHSKSRGDLKLALKSSWYHRDCFINIPEIFTGTAEMIDGFALFEKEDKDILRAAFEPKITKRKNSNNNDELNAKKPKKVSEVERTDRAEQKIQSDFMWNLRRQLQENVAKTDMGVLLETNSQTSIPTAPDKVPIGVGVEYCLCLVQLLDRLVDSITFGALRPCPMCSGQLVYSTSNRTYMCIGSVSAWTKCQYEHRNPARDKFLIGDAFQNHWVNTLTISHRKARFYPSDSNEAIVENVNLYGNSRKNSIVDRGNGYKSGHSGKSIGGLQNIVVKYGASVDPECELAKVVHVFRDEHDKHWQSVLGSVDLSSDKNSYYKIQLLKHDKLQRYYVFRSWGRTGTTRGGTKFDDQFGPDLEGAKEKFQSLFLEKTGNHWADLDNFRKVPNGMFPIKLDYPIENSKSMVKPGSKSLLPSEIKAIVVKIFDIATLKSTMKEFKIDMDKMPLGKLSRAQIEQGYTILTECQNLLHRSSVSLPTDFLDASNRFYTLIPHDFGIAQPMMLNHQHIIKEKTHLLDNLIDIEMAYSIMKDSEDCGSRDPVDVHYEKLNTAMEVLPKNSAEFKRIVEYAENTHAKTHTDIHLNIINVIPLRYRFRNALWMFIPIQIVRIDRFGESDRFEPFSRLHNRRLLWHGSRMANYAGILSQGLRIAPPEAPMHTNLQHDYYTDFQFSTGYMFGKGVYFADMISKSANYCHAKEGHGLLLLCEVALGDMNETKVSGVTQPGPGKHSVKGFGKTAPDPNANFVTDDGMIIPMGKAVKTNANKSDLLYNEYCPY